MSHDLDIYDFLSRKQFTFSGLVLMAHLLEITRSESNGHLIDKLTWPKGQFRDPIHMRL